jgi:hypothetical protein
MTKYFKNIDGTPRGGFDGTEPDGNPIEVSVEEYVALCYAAIPYEQKRMDAYPHIGDQLDALMKWAATAEVGPELKSIAIACMDVKANIPKT